MKLSRETDCAIRMLLCLAHAKQMLMASSLAKKIGVEQGYANRVGRKLRAAGLVDSVLGPYGGYSLNRTPESLTIYDIAAAFEDTMQCSQLGDHTDSVVIAADKYYSYMENRSDTIMKSHTLADVLTGDYLTIES